MTAPRKVTRKELTDCALACSAWFTSWESRASGYKQVKPPIELARLVPKLERLNAREQKRRGRTPRPSCAQAARQRELFRRIHDRGWTIQDIAKHFWKVRGQPWTLSRNQWKWTFAWEEGRRGLNLAELNILKQNFLNKGKPGVITVWRVASVDQRFFTRGAAGRAARKLSSVVDRLVTSSEELADLLGDAESEKPSGRIS